MMDAPRVGIDDSFGVDTLALMFPVSSAADSHHHASAWHDPLAGHELGRRRDVDG